MSRDELPSWFRRPQRLVGKQAILFPRPLDELLGGLEIGADELARWERNGWISAELRERELLQPWEEAELRIVAALNGSGLDESRISTLLDELPRPVDCSADRLTYSFRFGWVEPAPPPDPRDVVAEHIDSWLENLAREGRVEELAALCKAVVDLLAQAASGRGADGTTAEAPEH
jgi:hypothetical protein